MLRMLIGPARCRLVAGVLDFPVVATRGLWRRTLEHLRVRQFTLDFSGNRAPPLWCNSDPVYNLKEAGCETGRRVELMALCMRAGRSHISLHLGTPG